ncbi:MAG TPA: hypothetical protein VE053_06285 [Allosphingosinicella sp.]|nr:hypothetical protein [Allosphingosinicella sp.]
MRQFNLGGAWSKGTAFISQQAANHAIILIVMGIVVPAILQFAIIGAATGINPMAMGPNGFDPSSTMQALAGTAALVMIVSWVLQTGSYFGSWRIGLGRDETLGGAIVYGIICAVLALVAFLLLVLAMVFIVGAAMQGGGAMMILLLVVAIPMLILVAALYSVIMAAMAVGMFLMFLIVMAFGASMGGANPALAMAGQGVVGILIALVIVALLFWLTARLSCTTSVMADRKSFNLFAGIAESWRLTGPNQLRIMAYLGLLGIIFCVVLLVLVMILGASMMGSMSGGQVPAVGIGTQIMVLIVGIPFAYLTVLVPAGIYRELFEDTAVAEVFA